MSVVGTELLGQCPVPYENTDVGIRRRGEKKRARKILLTKVNTSKCGKGDIIQPNYTANLQILLQCFHNPSSGSYLTLFTLNWHLQHNLFILQSFLYDNSKIKNHHGRDCVFQKQPASDGFFVTFIPILEHVLAISSTLGHFFCL